LFHRFQHRRCRFHPNLRHPCRRPLNSQPCRPRPIRRQREFRPRQTHCRSMWQHQSRTRSLSCCIRLPQLRPKRRPRARMRKEVSCQKHTPVQKSHSSQGAALMALCDDRHLEHRTV
jgi:hypothetical protein